MITSLVAFFTKLESTVNPLKSFPGFESPDIDQYIANLSFNSRSAFVKKLAQPGMQKLGVPNVQRILQETMKKNDNRNI